MFNPCGARKLRGILERINIRKWIGGKAQVKVQLLTSCRDWTGWFLGIIIELVYRSPPGFLDVSWYY